MADKKHNVENVRQQAFPAQVHKYASTIKGEACVKYAKDRKYVRMETEEYLARYAKTQHPKGHVSKSLMAKQTKRNRRSESRLTRITNMYSTVAVVTKGRN
tara:strand:- start:409 stop:711 length:303 start_codon:yes stop_codon:yes gene_type:complete